MTKIRVVPGVGSEESVDFSRMLKRMFQRRAEPRGIAYTDADGVLTVESPDFACGEAGVHRLVRVSPFDPAKRRHTSFARVMVENDGGGESTHRSYILDPYRLVKDSSGWQREDVEDYLDGAD